ncbi:YfiR family protein [Ramlibacter tataouinensis]|uniref:YfiR family protein n=1 Tax=Ramlibacter tataouinensis TaxID=94132 RepID=UPI0022F38971|nr:YfiR family protein [Ramlibacter tataouinensis]WBY01717.1 YfiR family protein [Ramlibacter tataouinensis]
MLKLLLLLPAVSAWSQGPGSARESAVKAAFLYKFAGFVEWPAGTFRRADEPLVVGVLGNEAIAADLEQIAAGRNVDGRAVVVRRLRPGEAAGPLHVLLIGAGPDQQVREQAAAMAGPVLVVTEQPQGLVPGGVLNLVTERGRVRFAASLPAAETRGLRLSARLLAVAQNVEGRSR